jgi:uncharacterized protein DUF3224
MPETAHGTFTIELTPGQAELDGQISRMEFTKRFDGDLLGTGRGLMLSGGDPSSGNAGYVAIETVDGQLGGLAGGFALQQFGTMMQDTPSLQYSIVPGSGRGALEHISGELALTVEADGTHRYALSYQL